MSGAADEFDARMRRQFAGIDTSPEFAARLAARIATIVPEPAEARRARIERQREDLELWLRREFRTSAAAVVGTSAAALALVWRHAPAVAETVEGLMAFLADPGHLGSIAVAVLTVSAWPVLQRYLPR